MRRPILAGVLVLVMLLAGVLTARASGVLSGQWTANYYGHPLILQFKGSGNTYAGTYTLITQTKTKTYKSVLQVKAVVKVVNKVTTVTLTIIKTKNVVNCALVKGALRCIAINQQVIVFKHAHS